MFTEGTWAKIARLDRRDRELPTFDPAALPRTTAGNRTLLKLPTFPQADDAFVDEYADAFEKVLTHAAVLSEKWADECVDRDAGGVG